MLAPLVATLPLSMLPPGIAGLHLALGAGTVVLAGWTARRWGYSEPRAFAAAAIVALDPVLVVQSRSVMTETPAAFLVAATLAALTLQGSLGPLLGGIGFGLATLCRPSLLAPATLTIVAGLICGPGGPRARVGRALLLGLGVAVTLAPWAWRNARAVGEPVWTTTHGGYTLLLANNPVYYAEVLDGPLEVWAGRNQAAWFDRVNEETRGLGEAEADRRFRASAVELARSRPGAFARASVARLGRFWGIAPSASVYPTWLRAVTAAWTVPLWIALAGGLARRGSWRWPEISAGGDHRRIDICPYRLLDGPPDEGPARALDRADRRRNRAPKGGAPDRRNRLARRRRPRPGGDHLGLQEGGCRAPLMASKKTAKKSIFRLCKYHGLVRLDTPLSAGTH